MRKQLFKMSSRIILYVIIIIVIGIVYNKLKERSVLEQIDRAGKNYNNAKFNKLKEIEDIISKRDVNPRDEVYGILFVNYKEKYLKKNIDISLFFPAKRDYTYIIGKMKTSDNITVVCGMTYYYEKRTIVFEPLTINKYFNNKELKEKFRGGKAVNKYLKDFDISKQDIAELQKYILDVIIKTWIKEYGGSYEKEIKYIESLNKIDNTYKFPKKETEE